MMRSSLTRRDLLKGLLLLLPAASVSVAVATETADERHYQFMPGDLVHGADFIGARLVVWADQDGLVGVDNGFYGTHKATDSYHASALSLFEGLPGNRVNNPSMRHRLVREPGRIGHRYVDEPYSY